MHVDTADDRCQSLSVTVFDFAIQNKLELKSFVSHARCYSQIFQFTERLIQEYVDSCLKTLAVYNKSCEKPNLYEITDFFYRRKLHLELKLIGLLFCFMFRLPFSQLNFCFHFTQEPQPPDDGLISGQLAFTRTFKPLDLTPKLSQTLSKICQKLRNITK